MRNLLVGDNLKSVIDPHNPQRHGPPRCRGRRSIRSRQISAAICAYLADAFPEAGLAPALADPARGTYYRWLFFGAGCVDPATMDRMLARQPAERPRAIGY